MAQENDIEIYKNEDVVLPWVMDPVQDISTWTLKFTMKKRLTDAAALLEKTPAIPVGLDGRFNVTLTSANTTLPKGDYHYDVQRIDVGGVGVLSIGKFTIKQEVRVL